MELKDKVIAEIKKIYDPEIPVNIYELGLIYDIIIDDVSMMRNYRRQFYIMLKKGDTIDTIMKSMHDGAMK